MVRWKLSGSQFFFLGTLFVVVVRGLVTVRGAFVLGSVGLVALALVVLFRSDILRWSSVPFFTVGILELRGSILFVGAGTVRLRGTVTFRSLGTRTGCCLVLAGLRVLISPG